MSARFCVVRSVFKTGSRRGDEADASEFRAALHCHLVKRDVPVGPSPVRDDIFVETHRTNPKLRRSDIEGACRPAGASNERDCDDYKYSAPTELNLGGKAKPNCSGAGVRGENAPRAALLAAQRPAHQPT